MIQSGHRSVQTPTLAPEVRSETFFLALGVGALVWSCDNAYCCLIPLLPPTAAFARSTTIPTISNGLFQVCGFLFLLWVYNSSVM